MNRRLLGLSIAAAVGGALFAWVLFTILGGGESDTAELPSDDPRTDKVLAFVPQQLDRLNAAGPEAIYEVLDSRVKAVCTQQQWAAALAGAPAGAFREVKDITYNDDGTADVQIVVITPEGDEEITWKISFLPNLVPKIVEIPGSEECRPVGG